MTRYNREIARPDDAALYVRGALLEIQMAAGWILILATSITAIPLPRRSGPVVQEAKAPYRLELFRQPIPGRGNT
jgi:hypothetical protein